MPLVLRPPGTRPLPERLADLGQARRAAGVAAGGFTLLAGLIALVIVAGLLDAAVRLPPLPRAGLLTGILVAAGVGWLRLVRPPLRDSTHPLAVALHLEQRFPRLNDALASAVEFRHAAGGGPLPRFQRVAEMRAENLAERLDLRLAVPAKRAWGRFWLLVLTGSVAAVLALASPARAVAALLRLADPFGRHPWPTRTVITLTDAPTLLALGDTYPLRFQVGGVVPDVATVSVRPTAGAVAEEQVPVPEGGAVIKPLDPGRVSRDFEVRVTAGDGDTGWIQVEVAPPPRLVPVADRPSPQVRLSFPAYTDLPPTNLPDGTGVVEGVAGTRVSFRAESDRDIVSAAFVPQFDLAAYRVAAALAPLTSDNPLSAVLVGELAHEFASPIPVRCHGTTLAADFVPPLAGLYALRFTDARGLTGTRLIDFRLYPDHPPAVTLDRPAAGRDPLDLLPSARFNLSAAAEDRPFAVRWLAVEYRVGADGPFRNLPLADAEAAASLPAALGGGLVAPARLKPPAVAVGRVLAVAAFVRPDGKPPAAGDVITLRAAAADWDDRTALKEPGHSPEVELRIADRDGLETKFQKELAGLRPDLLRMREELRATRDKLVDDPAGPAADAAVKGVKARVDDPAAGLKAVTDRLRETKQANALPRSATTDKVEAAAEAARRLADRLDQADTKTTAARQANAKVAAEEAQAAVAAAEAEAAELLERLEQWGGAGEVRGEARALRDQVEKAGEQVEAADRASRDRAADKLDRAGDQAAGLVSKAGRLAVEKDAQATANRAAADTAPPDQADGLRAKADRAAAEAEALRRAVQAAGGEAIPEELRKAADELRKNRPGEAAAARQSAADRLAKLADPLAESPNPKRSQASAAADKLAAAQDELRKKTRQAEAMTDPDQRAEQLQKLAREQQKLKEEADRLAERLTREKNEPAAAAARDAAGQLAAAREQLQQGKAADQQQDEAAKRLDEVKKQLDPEQKKSDDKLSREQQAELADKLKALRDRQKAAVDEAARLVAAAAAAGQWDRPLVASLGDLDERETALAGELRPVAAKELADLPVFGKLAAQAADAMTLAGKRAAARRDDALADTPDPAADERLLVPMRAALRKLDQIVAAVSPDPADAKPKAAAPPAGAGGGGGGGGGQEGGGPPAGGGVPPLAQLKALRAMQAEVAEQTAAFADAHPEPARLTPDEQAELAALEQAQRDVAELFAKLAAAFRPPEELP